MDGGAWCLLSCTAVMGATSDNYLWIRENNGAIEFNTAKTFDKDGTNGNWNGKNPYKKNNWNADTKTYTNNMTLSSSKNNGKDTYENKEVDISYGLRLNGDMTGLKFINNSSIIGTGNNFGYGIYNTGKIKDIINIRIISGFGTDFGRGIYNSSMMGNIANTGIISGTGNGIYNTGKIRDVTNIGVIRGDGNASGIYNDLNKEITFLTNIGVIYGETNAIKNYGGTIGTAKNYGILVNGSDSNVVVDGLTSGTASGENKIVNYGLIIKNGSSIIIIAKGGNQTVKFGTSEREMTIKNADIEGGSGKGTSTKSFELKDGTNDYNNSILNGKDKTLKVTGSNNEIIGSIINAYGTAVVFEGANKQLTLSGTIVNGEMNNSAAILGSNNSDALILQSGVIKYKDGSEVTQNTIVNGNIDMGEGDDTLIIGAGTIINGIIDGGTGENTLKFGVNPNIKSNSPNSQEINIIYNISNFENMNINTNVTLFEKTIDANGEMENLKVTGVENITIGATGTLTLRIDSTNKDLSGKIIGHALYENTGEISSIDGGKLLLVLNGVGNESTISFGSTTLGNGLVTGNGGALAITSALHTLGIIDNKEVKAVVRENIPSFSEIPEYEKLNKIYHGILSVEDLIANFNVEAEQLSTFLGYLNDIYAGNPYSYSSELSRKSAGMFRDIAVESQFKPELNKWLIMGGLTHVDGGTKDTYYGKGYYTYDIGSSDMDADTKITGAYMLGEYGVSDTLTYGVLIGGNKLKSNLSNGSKVDGDALYMGAYAKKYVGNPP